MRAEEPILHHLTSGGRTPLEYCFLWYGCVYSWDPVQGAVFRHGTEDNDLFKACQAFLRSRGASLCECGDDEVDVGARCRRLDALARYAELHNWANREALWLWLDGWRRRYRESACAEPDAAAARSAARRVADR
jgi:hypothetical protein